MQQTLPWKHDKRSGVHQQYLNKYVPTGVRIKYIYVFPQFLQETSIFSLQIFTDFLVKADCSS